MAIDLDVVTRLNRATAREAAREAQQYFKEAGPEAGDGFMDGLSRSITANSPKVEKALNKVADASGRVIVEQEKLNALKESGNATDAKLIAQSERVAKAYRDEEAAIRNVNHAINSLQDDAAGAQSILQQLGLTIGSIGRIGTPAMLVPLTSGLGFLGGVAASAAQALLLLPAAVTAVGAAFGTLKLATSGFGDALENMGDPEKFAAALRELSPNAQQAALAIQNLMPAFNELQSVTQNALFEGVGEQLNQLATTYLPTVERMTTGIAGAFNDMFTSLSQTLQTPEIQADFEAITDNIVAAFQELTPAIEPLTSAFVDLVAVGSDFLPDLASAASDAARSFADFISEARQSGELETWIRDGLTTMKDLASIAMSVGKAFMALGDERTRNQLAGLADGLVVIANNVDKIATALRIVRDIAFPLVGVMDMLGMLDGKPTDSSALSSGRSDQIGQLMLGQAGTTGNPSLDGLLGNMTTPGAAAPGNSPGAGYPVPRPTGGLGSTVLEPASGPSWGPRPSPFAWDPTKGSSTAPPPTFDPSQWQVAPGAGSIPSGGVTPTTGYGVVDPGKVFDAETREMAARSNLESANLRLLEMQAKGNASQREIHDAKADITEKERALTAAQRELVEAQQGTWKKANEAVSGAMGDLNSVFAPLDQDFGVSGGLPGIVKNLTAFLGNLALGAAIKSSPELQSAAFSLMNPTAGYGGGQGGYSPAGFAGQRTTGYPGDAALLANVPAGRYTQEQRGDLTQGLADCSSAVEDLVNIMDGRPTTGASMYTGNAAEWLTQRGFLPGTGGPGDFRVGYNSGHMQATLPGGTPFNWGGNESAARGGVGGTGADDPAFTQHYYRPVGLPDPSAMGPAPLQPGLGPTPAYPGAAPGPSWQTGAGPGMLPTSAPSGQGAGFGYGNAPGAGGAVGASGLASLAPSAGPGGGGGLGAGGGLMDAAMASTAAIDMMAPGAGQAAKVGIQLANRAIKFGSQAAAIGVSGVMETFLPHNSALGDPGKSWFGKIAGGIAGARPAAPNAAGKSAPPQPVDPNTQQHGQGQGQPPGPMVHIENQNVGHNDGQGVANDIARQQYSMYSAGGPR